MQNIGNVVQGSESAFSVQEFDLRVARARELLTAAGLDVMIITGPENIFYLTGQQTPSHYTFQALLLPVEGDPVFVIHQLEYCNFIANVGWQSFLDSQGERWISRNPFTGAAYSDFKDSGLVAKK